jgi:hypothetical protein
MQAQKLDIKEAPSKLYAILDIKRRNEQGWLTYSAARRKDAMAVQRDLQIAYGAVVYAPNPRDSFISVKVAGKYPRVKNKAALAQLEAQFQADGIVKVRTEQGVIYRIPR